MSTIFKKLKFYLESKNHVCSSINPSEFKWCGLYPCSSIHYTKSCHYAQKALRNLEIDLRKKNHTCVKRCENTYPMTLFWCQKFPCVEQTGNIRKLNFLPPDREETPQIIWDVKKFLASLGHNYCCHVIHDNKLEWCQQEKCKVKPEKINIDWEQINKACKYVEERAKKLEENGHTCISMLESCPPQLQWCQEEPCKYHNDKKKIK